VAFIGRFRSVRFFFPFGQTIKFLLCEYFFSFRFFSLIAGVAWGAGENYDYLFRQPRKKICGPLFEEYANYAQ